MTDFRVGDYDFIAPGRIAFGWGRWPQVATIAASLGSRAFLVSGSRTLEAAGFTRLLSEALAAKHVSFIDLGRATREPEVSDVDAMATALRAHTPAAGDLVIALGGGSAIDLAKAVAAVAPNDPSASVRDYLEGVGRGLQIEKTPLPMIALPTTAGTGSEATKNAVISCYDPPFKKSLRADSMLPRAIVVDPQLAVTLPPAVTAATGMDAITQLIESYISRKAKPIPRVLAVDGLRHALGDIVEAVENGASRPAREGMAQAALLSGMALANSGLGTAHGAAAALGVHCRVSHGLACAATMLPMALKTNWSVCSRERDELAVATGFLASGAQSAGAALVDRIDEICQRLGMPQRLSQLGVEAQNIPQLVRDSRGNSMDGNPRQLSDAELTEILEANL